MAVSSCDCIRAKANPPKSPFLKGDFKPEPIHTTNIHASSPAHTTNPALTLPPSERGAGGDLPLIADAI